MPKMFKFTSKYKFLMKKEKITMRRKRLTTILVSVLLIASAFSSSAVFAAMPPDNTADPQTVQSCTFSFEATSSTKARAEVSAVSSGITPFITSKITLQSAPLGTTTFTDVSGSTSTKTVENLTAILHICTFSITSTKEYRIKVQLTDKVDGVQVTKTYYQALDR